MYLLSKQGWFVKFVDDTDCFMSNTSERRAALCELWLRNGKGKTCFWNQYILVFFDAQKEGEFSPASLLGPKTFGPRTFGPINLGQLQLGPSQLGQSHLGP